mgnify:FL=1
MKKKDDFKLNLKRTWKYIKKAKFDLIFYVVVSILEAIISAIMPLVSAKIILNITNAIIEQLILSSLVVLGLDVLIYICYFLKGLFYQKIYRKTLINIQEDVAREILKLEVSEIDKHTSGLFINRLNKDTEDISGLFMEYAYWLSYIITNLGVLIAIFVLSRHLFIYAIISSIVVYLINRKSLSEQYIVQKKLKTMKEEKTGLVNELIRGMRDIKVLSATSTMLKQTTKKIEDTTREQVKVLTIRRVYSLLEGIIRSLSDFIFIIFACFLYKKNLITIPTFIIVYNYQSKVKNLLLGIVQLSSFNKQFILASSRVYEIIYNDTFKKEKFGTKNIKKLEGNIEFKNVTFGYDENKTILKDVSFKIKPNERVAFVGKSGSGKTTFFNMLTRLYEKQSGEIYLDGNNIDDLNEKTIRNNMSIITQSPYIFNFSIKENLLLAKEKATMKEIKKACKLACIDDYIESLPDKYDTIVGENGVILSGGQKQRLAIARALIQKTKIILFDEATSALDNETQSKIQEAINNLKGEYTILTIAHRLATVVDSDKIFVVDKGKIIASGTHEELLKSCRLYKQIYKKDLQI